VGLGSGSVYVWFGCFTGSIQMSDRKDFCDWFHAVYKQNPENNMFLSKAAWAAWQASRENTLAQVAQLAQEKPKEK